MCVIPEASMSAVDQHTEQGRPPTVSQSAVAPGNRCMYADLSQDMGKVNKYFKIIIFKVECIS